MPSTCVGGDKAFYDDELIWVLRIHDLFSYLRFARFLLVRTIF